MVISFIFLVETVFVCIFCLLVGLIILPVWSNMGKNKHFFTKYGQKNTLHYLGSQNPKHQHVGSRSKDPNVIRRWYKCAYRYGERREEERERRALLCYRRTWGVVRWTVKLAALSSRHTWHWLWFHRVLMDWWSWLEIKLTFLEKEILNDKMVVDRTFQQVWLKCLHIGYVR